ncbi:MAG: NUDIX hydrolase [Clostridiales bacterium]|jgi:ADP-ribose pyrophosphatase YjhB (NUDIX family)|nr:NUDIX hydrolase [Clostridiales bacterium]
MNSYIEAMRAKVGHDTLMLPCSGVFVTKGGKLLLQRRKDSGKWADHGGSMEIGETFEETAKRELFEETGLVANSLEFFGLYSGKDFVCSYPNGDKACLVIAYWICEDFSGEFALQEDEVLELKWFDFDDLPENMARLCKKPINDFVEAAKKRQGAQ